MAISVLTNPTNFLLKSLKYHKNYTGIYKTIHVTHPNSVKEIKETREGKTTTIEGIIKESSRKAYLINTKTSNGACPLCALGLKNLKYTDVLIISQFIEKDGEIMTQSATQLCNKSYEKMLNLVDEANKAGLLWIQRPQPWNKELMGWEKCNTYFHTKEEELVIARQKRNDPRFYYEKAPKTKRLTLEDIL